VSETDEPARPQIRSLIDRIYSTRGWEVEKKMGVSEHERVSTRDKERAVECKEGHTRSRQKRIQFERGSLCEKKRLPAASSEGAHVRKRGCLQLQ